MGNWRSHDRWLVPVFLALMYLIIPLDRVRLAHTSSPIASNSTDIFEWVV